MKKNGLILLTVIILLSSCSRQQLNNHLTNGRDTLSINKVTSVSIADLTLKSTVAITMQDKNRQSFSLGSGVIIDEGIIVTNLHVIAGAAFGHVQLPNSERKYIIEGYIAIDKFNDIAILSVPSIRENMIKINADIPKIGEKIFAAGNPQGLVGTFSEGNVSSIRQLEDKELIQITAPISPGSSGGPVVNEKAELIGIAVGTLTNGQNLNFAVPSKYITQLLNDPSKEVKQFDIGAEKKSSPKVTDIKNGIVIRNVVWSDQDPTVHNDGAAVLLDFSLLNITPYSISDVALFFILYDRTGTPVDYASITV